MSAHPGRLSPSEGHCFQKADPASAKRNWSIVSHAVLFKQRVPTPLYAVSYGRTVSHALTSSIQDPRAPTKSSNV